MRNISKIICMECMDWFYEDQAGYDDGKLAMCVTCADKFKKISMTDEGKIHEEGFDMRRGLHTGQR